MKRIAWRLSLLLAVVIVWQAASAYGLLNPLFVPAPSALVRSAYALTISGELGRNAGATLGRAALGFLLGSIGGLVIGLAMGTTRVARRSLEPVISAINSTPKLSLLPLLLLFFGVGETARIILIALSALIVVSIHVFDAIANIHPAWVELAINYGARKRDLFSAVYVPACLPQIFTGFRLALSSALVIAVSCELVSPSTGLGSMIWLAWETFSTDRLYVAILLTAVLGGSLHEALRILEKRVVPWKVPDRV
jgi:ABC-type nitrate/sulfonate/bicarbonate transport system permease component